MTQTPQELTKPFRLLTDWIAEKEDYLTILIERMGYQKKWSECDDPAKVEYFTPEYLLTKEQVETLQQEISECRHALQVHDREQRLKEEVDKCLIAGNSLASIFVGYELPEGHEEWSHQTASSYFYDTYYNDRKSAYEGYETWLAWKTIRDVSKTLSTLYPDTPAPKEGTPDDEPI